MADLIQLRRDLAANWTTTNPVLAQGELGIETDTLRGKIGDGVTEWNSLPYVVGGTPWDPAADGIVYSNGKVNIAQSMVAGTQLTAITGDTELDFLTYQNFQLTLTDDATLTTPVNPVRGQTGFIIFAQESGGGKTVSLGPEYKTEGGNGLTLSTDPSAIDIVPYAINSVSLILLGTPQKAFA